jgi:hypothetical protein
MPHYANAASSGKKRYDSHEEALSSIFEANGYTRIEQFSMGKNRNGKNAERHNSKIKRLYNICSE